MHILNRESSLRGGQGTADVLARLEHPPHPPTPPSCEARKYSEGQPRMVDSRALWPHSFLEENSKHKRNLPFSWPPALEGRWRCWRAGWEAWV